MQWEVGVIKLTANRRQFSPISLNRGENRQNCLTHYGIRGIIAPAFTGLAKI